MDKLISRSMRNSFIPNEKAYERFELALRIFNCQQTNNLIGNVRDLWNNKNVKKIKFE